jgi:DNA-binding SARP family transcriptional activator/TolB-like protein
VRGRPAHRRRIALLAILAAARGRAVGREKVLGLLWPEHPGDAARHLLSESLYVLRKALGDRAFVTVGDEIALNGGVMESDVGSFEEAVEAGNPAGAVALYRGPFLDGFYLSDAREFEHWVDGERSRLARIYAAALERLAEEAEKAEDFLGAAAWWRTLAGHDPYSSRVVLRLMRVLELGGEHVAALHTAAEHATFLREDVGAQPDPAVPTYAERLRNTPPAGRVPPIPEPYSEPVVPIEEDPPRVEALPPVVLVPPNPVPETVPTPVTPSQRGPRVPGARRAMMAGSAVALMLVLATIAARREFQSDAPPPARGFDPRHIAVLYFEDHTRGDTLRHIANDLTARIIDELARTPSLRVVSANGVKRYRDSDVSSDSIARALKVGTLVTGSLQAAGGRVEVIVRLEDPVAGRQIASRSVVTPVGDLLTLEAEVVRTTAEFLRPRLGREIRVREDAAGTRSAVARERFARGQARLEQARTMAVPPRVLDTTSVRRILASADSLLAEASQADPRWAGPWILRGWVALARRDVAPGAEMGSWLDAAIRYAERGLALHPGDAEGLELRGTARWRMVQLGPLPPGASADSLSAAAERDLNRALSIDSSLARAWATLSQLLRVQNGRLAAADAAARRALEADEFLEEAPLVIERLYRSSLQLARHDMASWWCDEGQRRFPTDWRFVECRLTLLGIEGAARPDPRAAERLFRELEQLDPPEQARAEKRPYTPIYRRMALARVAARVGLADSARALIAASRLAVGSDPELRSSLLYDEAYVRFLLEEREAVFALLQEYLRENPQHRKFLLTDQKFRALHADPRFQRLIAGSRPVIRVAPEPG